MQRDVVCGVLVYTLDNVNFPACGPVVEIGGPERRPRSAGGGGEVGKVGDDEDFVV